MIDVFFGLYNPSPTRPKTPFTYLVYVYNNISLSKGHLGSRGVGEASKNKLKYTSFIIPMTNVLILSVFRTHAQNGYHKVLEMKSTSIINILVLLLFENKQCICSKSGLNGIQYKDVKLGVGVESASFHGFVNDESFLNMI